MKGLAESSPFHLLTNPHMINRFIFGHGVVIYYKCSFLNHLENASARRMILFTLVLCYILYKIIRSDMGVADEYPRSLHYENLPMQYTEIYFSYKN